MTVSAAGLTVTVATGFSITVTTVVLFFPSLVAVMPVVPVRVCDAVTNPVDDPTVAIVGSLEVQVTVRPVRMFPLPSRVVAVNVKVLSCTIVGVVGEIVTVATGTVGSTTVTIAVPLFVSDVAVIVAEPAATAVTTPLDETVATLLALVDQVTTRPVNVAPVESRTVAESVTVPPGLRLAVPGETLTDATGIGGGGATDVTTTCAVPLFPSAVAVIVVVPAPIADTRPAVVTVAMDAFAVAHVMGRPPSTLPCASVVTALSDVD
jgi:hypothetical protein